MYFGGSWVGVECGSVAPWRTFVVLPSSLDFLGNIVLTYEDVHCCICFPSQKMEKEKYILVKRKKNKRIGGSIGSHLKNGSENCRYRLLNIDLKSHFEIQEKFTVDIGM